MHRHGQHVVVVVVELVFVEVVTDPGAVGEELLDGDPVIDQREVGAEDRTRGGVQVELAALHEAHHGQRSEPLRAAGDAELRVGVCWDAEAAVRQPVRPLHGDAAVEVHPDHTREADVGGDPVDEVTEPVLLDGQPPGFVLARHAPIMTNLQRRDLEKAWRSPGWADVIWDACGTV